jgi:hypothetical protein
MNLRDLQLSSNDGVVNRNLGSFLRLELLALLLDCKKLAVLRTHYEKNERQGITS